MSEVQSINHKGGYIIESTGRVYDLVKKKMLDIKTETETGELFVSMRPYPTASHQNRKYMRNLIAKNFLPDREFFRTNARVVFKDGDIRNIDLENLEIVHTITSSSAKRLNKASKSDFWNINDSALYS